MQNHRGREATVPDNACCGAHKKRPLLCRVRLLVAHWGQWHLVGLRLRARALTCRTHVRPSRWRGILLLLLIYIYGVIGTTTFSKNDPIHFGNLPISMISLFRAATFEDWTDLMYIQMYGCDTYGYKDAAEQCTSPSKLPVASVFYFISFIVISGLVILNLVIGVIIQSMTEVKRSLEKDEELRKTIKNIDFIVKKIRARKFEQMLDEDHH